jgi:hypothetical protein
MCPLSQVHRGLTVTLVTPHDDTIRAGLSSLATYFASPTRGQYEDGMSCVLIAMVVVLLAAWIYKIVVYPHYIGGNLCCCLV